jgi:hypothetical protein
MCGIFLNSSRILKNFRKNTICHAIKCILCKIIFKMIFICKTNSISNIYALLCWRDFSLGKSGCYKPTPLEESHPRDSGSTRK